MSKMLLDTQPQGFPGGSDGLKKKNPPAMHLGFIPGFGRFPWRREWLSTPVFLSGEFHGQRSLVGYSLWGRKELDMTELETARCSQIPYPQKL